MDEEIEGRDYVVCQVCGGKFENLSSHLTRTHKMAKEEYLELYPNSLLISTKLKLSLSKNTSKQWENENYKNFMVNHLQDYWCDEDNKFDQSKRLLEYNKLHPEAGKKHSDDMKEVWLDDDKRKKQQITLTEVWNDKDRRDKSSKDNIERLSKLTQEEIMKLTFGMRNYWNQEKRDEQTQWQRDRWTPEMRSEWGKIIIQRYIDNPELREDASRKTTNYYESNLETFIERGKLISAGHQKILREEWDHFIWEETDWRDWHNVTYINKWFKGCHRHHITKTIVIHIPSELHQHISHNLKTGRGMGEMNMLALQFINGYYND